MQRHAFSPYIGATFRGVVARTMRRGETYLRTGEITRADLRQAGAAITRLKSYACILDKRAAPIDADHFLQTPDTFVRAPLPGMQNATAIVHVGPAAGARFTQYTAEFEAGRIAGARLRPAIRLRAGRRTGNRTAPRSDRCGDYAYLPRQAERESFPRTPQRACAVIEKPYQALPGVSRARTFSSGRESDIAGRPFMGDDALEVRALVPDDPAFDFAVNTMIVPARRDASDGRDPCDGARAADAGGRRHLSPGRPLVSGDGGRFHLDGAVLPAMVRRARQDAGEISDL